MSKKKSILNAHIRPLTAFTIIVIALTLIITLTLSLLEPRSKETTPKTYLTSEVVLKSGPTPTPIPTVAVPKTKLYSFPNLGISINVASGGNVTEIGDKVYVYETGRKPESGQFVQVISKNPTDSLADAITKQFLPGKSPNDCFVKLGKYDNRFPSNFVTAVITYPGHTGRDGGDTGYVKCPTLYTEGSGSEYFVMDKDHPDRYIFLDLGQSSLSAGLGDMRAWQESVKVFK